MSTMLFHTRCASFQQATRNYKILHLYNHSRMMYVKEEEIRKYFLQIFTYKHSRNAIHDVEEEENKEEKMKF